VSDLERSYNGANPLNVAPGLIRIAAGAWWRTTEWSIGTSVRVGSRVFRAAVSGESANELLNETRDGVRDYARRLLGVVDVEQRVRNVAEQAVVRLAEASPGNVVVSAPTTVESPRPLTEPERRAKTLAERGAELLAHSADVRYEESAHPAYERILSELAPDEGRILRHLALDGPQPSVDVRGAKTLAVGSSALIAPGLTMIGNHAGVRYHDRVPAYLNNLYRLGLIWFSREPLEDPHTYQVLEAQPDVLAAIRAAGRGGKTVRRSIHLTPFGEDFCKVCLPLQTAELEALPGSVVADQGEAPGPAPTIPG
jgi:hypothetical protein